MTKPEDRWFVTYPMKLDPSSSPRPWGGDRLKKLLHKRFPDGEIYGESWELSDHPDGRSKIIEGPYAGRFFGDVVRDHPKEMCGVLNAPPRFPLIVKFIDAAENLSIQVHPDHAFARAKGEQGKDECWYIMDCADGAEIIYGLREDVTAEDLRRVAGKGSVADLVRHCPIHAGSYVDLPAGTVHAIPGGTLLCEIQQASNLTYRLWDWDRVPVRPIHVAEAVASAHYGAENARSVIETAGKTGEIPLARNSFFDVRLLSLPHGRREPKWKGENRHGLIVSVVSGDGKWESDHTSGEWTRGSFQMGETWFWPAGLVWRSLSAGQDGLRLLLTCSVELEKFPV